MARAPHLLYVAWAFPPARAGGVYRAVATVNAFAEAGWSVTVLTADRAAFERFTGVDESLEAQVHPSVSVRRVPFSWPVRETDIATYSALRAYLPPVWRRQRAWRDQVPFPEVGYGPWRRPLERAALDVHAQRPVDLVLATANPHVTFAAAAAVHRSAGVPYVMDYRDAWTLDVFSGERLASPRSRTARWERRLQARAAEVWFVNEPIRAWHAREYPDTAGRMHVVANGWDRGTVDDATPGAALAPRRFGYLGTVTPKVPLAELVAGWRTAVEEGLVDADATLTVAGYLGYFSAPQPEMLAAVESHVDVGVRYVGPVPKTEVASFYADVDVLVLALGAGRYVTSGKVFEYLATGKPIVSVHDPRNAAGSILEGYPLWARTPTLSVDDVAAALGEGARLAGSATEEDRAAARRHAERYRRDLQLEPRVAALTELVGAP